MPGWHGSSISAVSNCILIRSGPEILIIRMNCASISIQARVLVGTMSAASRSKSKAFLENVGLRGWPKTSGSRGMHINVRIHPRWTFTEVRRAALALSREIERRAPALATSKWWKEERHGVFLDYNQNAKDRTTCSAYSVRPLPDAACFDTAFWSEVPDCDPRDFTVFTVPRALCRNRRSSCGHGRRGRLARKTTGTRGSQTKRKGLGDAPWPPHFRKMEGEAPRVAPSRASPQQEAARQNAAARRRKFS